MSITRVHPWEVIPGVPAHPHQSDPASITADACENRTEASFLGDGSHLANHAGVIMVRNPAPVPAVVRKHCYWAADVGVLSLTPFPTAFAH